jgi:hypothetical protein
MGDSASAFRPLSRTTTPVMQFLRAVEMSVPHSSSSTTTTVSSLWAMQGDVPQHPENDDSGGPQSRGNNNNNNNFDNAGQVVSRRILLHKSVLATAVCFTVNIPADKANAMNGGDSFMDNLLLSPRQADSAKLETGLLDSRLTSNVINPPTYGMEGTDVFYPM